MTAPAFSRWQLTCARCGDVVAGGGAVILRGSAICVACWACPGPAALENGSALYPYQREGVAWLAGSRAMLLADEPGLGKTAQSLAALGDASAIVVVLPSVRRQWHREAQRWAPAHRTSIVEHRPQWRAPSGREIIIVGYTTVRGCPPLPRPIEPGTVLICDEAQAIKNPQAQQTAGVRWLADQVRSAGGRVWLLTATPAYANPRECWEVLRAAELHRALHPIGTQWELLPADEQQKRLARVMLRRRTRDVVDLPPVRWERISVELPDESVAALDAEAARVAARAQLDAENPDTDISDAQVDARAARLSSAEVREAVQSLIDAEGDMPLATVRKLCAIAKLPRALELAEEHEHAMTPLVYFSDHRIPVQSMGRRNGWGIVLGGQTPRERDGAVSAFREGRLIGMAVGYAAGGTGLDGLQERAARCVLGELPWTPAVLEQALGRLVRIGQRGASVLVSHLIASHWVDEMIESKLADKCRALDGLGIGLSLAGSAVA